MLCSKVGLLAVFLAQCYAQPVIQVTVYAGSPATVLHRNVQNQHNMTLNEVLATIDDFQKNATAIGKAAATFPAFPDKDASDEKFNAWMDLLVGFHYKLKNQTANAKNLEHQIYGSDSQFNNNDTIKVMDSLIKFMNNLNQTELDPLVQFSKRTFKDAPYFRNFFTDHRVPIFGGLVGWDSAMRDALTAYRYFFSYSEDFPRDVEDRYFETELNATYAMGDAVRGFLYGEWPEFALSANRISLKESL